VLAHPHADAASDGPQRPRHAVADAFDNDRNLRAADCGCWSLPMTAARIAPRPDPAAPPAAAPGAPSTRTSVAYVMNAFPRLSETFIAHEIHQLERLGMGRCDCSP
jgi:hypothetical protein